MRCAMTRVLKGVASSIAFTLLLYTAPATALVSVEQADQLGRNLTPFGAVRAGNESGTIPPWTGGYTDRPEGYQQTGQHHLDPYPEDQPFYQVNSHNLDDYRKILGEGVAALMRTYPETFQVNVYPTRRSHSAPKHVEANTWKNAVRARLVADGNGITGGYGGIPFPILSGSNSEMAMQAMWNHLTRWRGVYSDRTSAEVAVTRDGQYMPVILRQEAAFNFYNPKADATSLNNTLSYYLSTVMAPKQFAGGGILVHDPLNQVEETRKAWGFNAGQRKVRRAPSLAYDSPIASAANLRTVDDTDMFNGALDRYNWRYVGLKEVLIPYNNYRIGKAGLPFETILDTHHLNADLMRWELHRVHVVEAHLKPGARHIYKKRRFYLDEDSWNVAMVDQFDAEGDLWRVSLAMLKNFYDLPGVWTDLEAFHDLKEQRYNVQGLNTELPATRAFSDTPPNERYFSPASLRRRLGR